MTHYTPILRWKRGERVALQNVATARRTGVTPLLFLAADQFKGKEPNSSSPARTAAECFVTEVRNAWGIGPFYLDASGVAPTPAHPHPLVDIALAARAAGLQLIPATRQSASGSYQADVQAVAAIDLRGVALRVDMQGLTSAATWTGSWAHALGDTDLIVDFADQVGVVAAMGGSVVHAFSTLHAAGAWRMVSVAGSNIPANLTGYVAGVHTLPRAEYQLWQQLDAAGLHYPISFGDYCTVPLAAPPAGIAWGFPISVRYTLDQEFLICRGVGTTGFSGVDMDLQLTQHAQTIVGFPARARLAGCWADDRIDAIAAASSGPGNLESWVQISVNRHIELTRDRLP